MEMMTRKTILFISLAFFLIISFLFIHPDNTETDPVHRSSELRRVTREEDGKERTDYVDEEGRVTFATDLGYATVIAEKKGNGILEHYYDQDGEPVSRYIRYYGIYREYDEDGNNICNTYLGRDDRPATIFYGYAIEKKEYDADGRLTAVRYYDTEGKPACTSLYGYVKVYEYNEEGRRCRTVFLDTFGNPMMTGQGYASITYAYTTPELPENSRAEKEFYFDSSGNPARLSLGQYGALKEYNEYGQETAITYLGADGNPIRTNKGYTTIRKTYLVSGYAASEKYYDENGEPFALPEGQYGVRTEDGQTAYMNENGEDVFNPRIFLYNHSRIVILAAMILVLLSAAADKRVNVFILALYIGVILYFTLIFRESSTGPKGMSLFRSYRQIIRNPNIRADILRNIWLFIPFGAILYRLYPRRRILLVPIALSIAIEGIQLFTGAGLCEPDDVISNGLGGTIGYGFGSLAAHFIGKVSLRRKNRTSYQEEL